MDGSSVVFDAVAVLRLRAPHHWSRHSFPPIVSEPKRASRGLSGYWCIDNHVIKLLIDNYMR